MTDFLTFNRHAQALLEEKVELTFWQQAALKAFGPKSQETPLIRLLILDLLDRALEGTACLDLTQWLEAFLKPLPLESDCMQEVAFAILSTIKDDPCLKYDEPWLYIKSYWDLEERLKERLNYFSTLNYSSPTSHLTDESFLEKLNLEQKQAVLASLQVPFLIVAGGPGTGKTFTAAAICEGLKQTLILKKNKVQAETKEQGNDQAPPSIRIALLAPTGKAAIRLHESIVQASKSSSEVFIESMTIHSYLAKGMKEGGYHFLSNPAPYDIILVDEASMIDAVHFDELFKTVHTSTHLILMGDPDQLPPVEGPGLFLSMVTALSMPKENSPSHCVHLKRPVRAQNQALVQAAKSIREGDEASWKALVDQTQEVKNQHLEQTSEVPLDPSKPFSESLLRSKLDEILLASFNQAKVQAFQPVEKVLRALTQEMLLCVSRIGPWGTGSINEKLFQKLRILALKESWPYLNIPVMATVNQPAIERMNGQMGLLRVSLSELERLDTLVAVLTKAKHVYFQTSLESFIMIPCIRLEKMQPAWAITVHKSQGSEFDAVQLLLTEKALLFGPTLLYTACTRAKKTLQVWSYGSTLSELFKLKIKPSTGMTRRLIKGN